MNSRAKMHDFSSGSGRCGGFNCVVYNGAHMIDFTPFLVEENGAYRLIVGDTALADIDSAGDWEAYHPNYQAEPYAFGWQETVEEDKLAAERAVSEWLEPVLKAVLGEPVAVLSLNYRGKPYVAEWHENRIHDMQKVYTLPTAQERGNE